MIASFFGSVTSMKLLYCAPAPVIVSPSGYCLDVKFLEGMRAHAAAWGGPVHCVLWRGATSIPFGKEVRAEDLGFELTVLDAGSPLPDDVLRAASVASISIDMPNFEAMLTRARDLSVPVVLTLEYTLETRLRIVWLDDHIGLLRRLRRSLWQLRHERRIRRAIQAAAGVQFNGYPAFDAYAKLSRRPMQYFDNRMTPRLMASEAEMAARAQRLRAGEPLRLIHSGRLESMKGAQDLLPVMTALRAQGVNATLDIYGAGQLEGQIRAGLAPFEGRVRLHSAVDFEGELVPINRTQADVFVSCHRQSDPSCSYVEAMGCGLAVVGYANRMWSRLSEESGAGRAVDLGNVTALAQTIAGWDRDREAVIAAAKSGLLFARAHDFPQEFTRRMEHLRACAA